MKFSSTVRGNTLNHLEPLTNWSGFGREYICIYSRCCLIKYGSNWQIFLKYPRCCHQYSVFDYISMAICHKLGQFPYLLRTKANSKCQLSNCQNCPNYWTLWSRQGTISSWELLWQFGDKFHLLSRNYCEWLFHKNKRGPGNISGKFSWQVPGQLVSKTFSNWSDTFYKTLLL